MTSSDKSVSCAMCGRRVENENGWEACERCWYTGRYLGWVIDEIAAGRATSDLIRAYNLMTGRPWDGGKASKEVKVAWWKDQALVLAPPGERARVAALMGE